MYGASGSTESILKGPRRRRKAHLDIHTSLIPMDRMGK
jgi:hypothetical protein